MIQKGSRGDIAISQFRAARALLGWSQADLAKKAGLSVPTIKRMEGQGTTPVSPDARERARVALETAGITFFGGKTGRLGVALDKRGGPKTASN
jgi:transcriptional regulator with XRE-family HTH domain